MVSGSGQTGEIRHRLTRGGNKWRGLGQVARGSPFIVAWSTRQNGGRDVAGRMGTGGHLCGG
jgi:hypothetical protein